MGWKRCEDELPDNDRSVIALVRGQVMPCIAFYDRAPEGATYESLWVSDDIWPTDIVTHWHELPSLP